jgi:exopolysaccharide biosynthesis polyprenyl glycosylphosphotransferase
MANGGLLKELQELEPAPGVTTTLPHRDVRARRPFLLRAIIRLRTLRAIARVLVLGALDAAGIFLAIWTALELKAALRDKSDLTLSYHQAQDVAPLAILVTLLLFARSDLYADRAVRPGFTRVVASLFQATIVVLLFAVVQGEQFSSFYIFYGSLLFALIYVSAFRWLFEKATGAILRLGGYHRSAILVGTGAHIEAVAHALKGSEIHPIGFVSLVPRPDNGLKNLGTLEDIESHFDSVDEVLITDPDFPQERALALIDTCHRHGIRVRVAPSTMEILMDRVEFVPGQTLPLFELKPPVFDGIDFVLKRTFDIVGSLLLLVLLSPFLLVAAVIVKLSSRGPVIYKSMRPGIGGRPFACFKFRTMYENAEDMQHELEPHNEVVGGAIFKIREDPRVTPIGRFLRRWSLDELPQLLNVLKGDMSLVGPRPLPMRDYERLEDWHRKRYLVLPGMTGLWQVSGRSELDFDELVRLDFLYLERWSIFLDLSILLKTIPAVIRAHGAW